MTNKEAKGNLMYALKWNDMPEKEALKIAIKALDNEDVFDKIRAEIEKISIAPFATAYTAKHEALEIIDRYREGENK